jgi:hypothetical protein
MDRGSAQYHEDYVPPKGDAMGSKRSSAVKNALQSSMRTPPQVTAPRAEAAADREFDTKKKLQRMEQARQLSGENKAKRKAARAARAARKATSGEPAPSRFQEAVREGSIAVSDATTAAPATPSVVDLPEGSEVETVGAVTRYRPQGDPFTYEYDASTQSFSAFTLDGTPVITGVTEGDPAYGEFLKHAKGERTRYYGGGSAAPKAPGAEAPAAEAPEGATGIPELDQTSDREMDASVSERGDTAMSPEARPDTSMTDDADALPQGNTLLGPTAGALAARGAGRAAMAGAEEAATRGGRMARAAGLREGLDDAEQLRRMKAAGETRGRISYAQQLMEGKRGSAPSTRAGISKQLIDEVVDDISPDDLSPELRRYYDNFDAKTLRQLDLDAADKYLVARLKQNAGSREAAAAAEFFGEAVDDKAAQSLGTKLRIPSAPTGQQLREGAEGVFRGARTAAARAAANPGQVAKMAGRGALATMSAVPDPTDFIMLAAAAPVLGLQELGAREDFGRQLELIAPRYNAAEREPFTLDQLSSTQKQDVREFVLNSPQPLSAAKELLEMRRFITDEALAEIIAE